MYFNSSFDISSWMPTRHLTLDMGKTELIFPSSPCLTCVRFLPQRMAQPSNTLLEAKGDKIPTSSLFLCPHIQSMKYSYFQLSNTYFSLSFLSIPNMKPFPVLLVFRSDYCRSQLTTHLFTAKQIKSKSNPVNSKCHASNMQICPWYVPSLKILQWYTLVLRLKVRLLDMVTGFFIVRCLILLPPQFS